MTAAAETTPMPPHFDVHPNLTGKGVMLKDRRTGKHVTVPMMAYFDVRRVLQALDL